MTEQKFSIPEVPKFTEDQLKEIDQSLQEAADKIKRELIKPEDPGHAEKP